MADLYPLQAPVVLSEGNYATPPSVQFAFNTLTAAIRLALNTIATGGSFSNVNINGGTIDGVTIGGLVPGPASFTSLTVNGTPLPVASGTWNPTLLASTTNPTVVVNGVTNAKYTRIGRLVFIEGYFFTTSQSGGAGDAQIGGLPFLASADARGAAIVNVVSFALPSGGVSATVAIIPGTSTLGVFYTAANTTPSPIPLPISSWPAADALISFGITYTTS